MKAIKFLAILAAPLAIAACSDRLTPDNPSEDTVVRMTLDASVSQEPESKAAFDDVTAATWTFSFTGNDNLSVNNTRGINTYYTFTREADGAFTSEDAVATTDLANWYAFYPELSAGVTSYANQSGTVEGAAALYGLAGKQNNVPAGTTDLSIALTPQMAILKIVNWKGNISIAIKKGDTFFSTMKAGLGKLTPQYVSTSTSVFKTSQKGTYYVCVPAGEQIDIYDGTTKIKSTKAAGLTAGKYYTVQIDHPNLISGAFSVSATKKVQFTKGNLYRDSKSSWKLESSQIAFPSSWDENHVGHLYFCDTDDYPDKTYASSYSISGRTIADDLFGTITSRSINGDYGVYYNLGRDGWEYLFNSRPNHASLYRIGVIVEGVGKCLIIAPDDFVGEIASNYATEAEVTSAGLVCLPPAGEREGTTINTDGLSFYWTGAPGTDITAGNAFYPMAKVEFTSTHARSYGCPVRLVQAM